jgi:hypothetical protein
MDKLTMAPFLPSKNPAFLLKPPQNFPDFHPLMTSIFVAASMNSASRGQLN